MMPQAHYPAFVARDNSPPLPPSRRSPRGKVRLWPFDARFAPLVSSWISNPTEAYWLAPRTPPPITARRIAAWQVPGSFPLMLTRENGGGPLAYGELNLLNTFRSEYWLGHLIVDPARRGCGLGRELTRLLLERAFERLHATRVTLVVFAENVEAVRCYESLGFIVDGIETHYFPPYRREAELTRMSVRLLPK